MAAMGGGIFVEYGGDATNVTTSFVNASFTSNSVVAREELLKNRTVSGREKDILADEIRTVQEQTGIIALKFEEEKAQATKLFQKLETSVHNYHDRLFGVEIENVNTVSTSHT